MTKSINQIDKELSLLCADHMQVNQYIFDDFVNAYDSKLIKHTAVIAMCYSINEGKEFDDMVLTLTVCDKVFTKDLRNRKDVCSDTYRILRNIIDIIMSSKRWNSFSSVKGTSSSTYFRYGGSDHVDGWKVDITLKVANTRDLCAIPLRGNYDLNLDISGVTEN